MSDVIRFQPAKATPRSAPDDHGAQILFFTGVRYQRLNEEQRAPRPQASTQRQGEGGGSERTRRR